MANSRLCLILECCNPLYAKGYCQAHYLRLRKHGDPLGGSTPKGEPLRFIHEVSLQNTGDECVAWPFGKNSWGYGTVTIDGKKFIASRYVCELVNGPPPTPEHEAAHSCGKGNEACIAPGHLSWKTNAENQADRLEHGTHSRGERNGRAKITEPEAREILALKGIETQRAMAARFAVSRAAISDIHTGRNWAWLQP
ncbi:hypothetical protein ELI01_18640 [Rhizobium leguminosarum]|uniref:hypothetical protein n=1 Tax=Rhizobium leguminosarum TaxID=384 RepID=UPI0010315CFF|nr:hypothetical protein [Rhizobium leguminosarum]TAX57100.1 hypothetical protein ELI01_18640 [Rhizobium leguminosarum]